MNPTDDDGRPIRLEFEITREDYAEAWRVLLRTNRKADPWWPMQKLGIATSAVGLFLAAVERGDAGAVVGAVLLMVVGGCVIGWAIQGSHRAVQLDWARYSQATGLLTWEFDAAGVRATTPVSSTTYRWEAFTRLADSKGLLVLYHRSGHAIFLPRRAFRDEAEQQAFRQLVRSHVAKPVGGFPVVAVAPARADQPGQSGT